MATTTIVLSAAIDLLHRLTESLEIPFTLTDRDGAVVASTAGRPAGQADAYALAVARSGVMLEFGEEQLRLPEHIAIHSPAAEHAGLLPPAPGIYMPVRMDGAVEGVLFARGAPEDVRTKAKTAAAVAGITLEFARGASSSTRLTLGPDFALRGLLRGNQLEARRATLLIKVSGWDLLAPRVALVITAADRSTRLPDATHEVVRDLLNALLPNSPSGQLGPAEIVVLPALPTSDAEPSIEHAAQEIQQALAGQGLSVVIGIGEVHIDMPILPGLRRSYREALFSAQWATQSSIPGGVHSLRSLGPAAFLAPGLRGRQRFASDLLEPLRKYPEILETVRVFLDSDLSLEAAAKSSGLHRHTVRTHLQRARELSGLDARVLSDAVQLKLAFLLSPISVQSV
jgi:sugar diacid utilization regulator